MLCILVPLIKKETTHCPPRTEEELGKMTFCPLFAKLLKKAFLCMCFISHFSGCRVAGDELWHLTGNFSLLCNIIVLLWIPGTEAGQSQRAAGIKQLVCFSNYKLQLYNQSLGIHNGEREKHVGYFFSVHPDFYFPISNSSIYLLLGPVVISYY